MDDLVRWLGQQLDEDERIARAAYAPNWSTDGQRGVYYGIEDEWMTDALTTADADHIAAHDPARVLREVDAKRRVLDWYKQRAAVDSRGEDPDDYENVTGSTLETVVQMLALPYADRPGYRDDWRP